MLSLALLLTCIIALIVWRRRRASTSSGRLPSIALPSLGRSRLPRFNRLVNEAEFQSVSARAGMLCVTSCRLQSHADEQRSLIGVDAGGDVGAPDGSAAHNGHSLIDFGDDDSSNMSFVTNRPQVRDFDTFLSICGTSTTANFFCVKLFTKLRCA
jgi:hypothetical protein